jgi:starvation-inducible DNA-binding protein
MNNFSTSSSNPDSQALAGALAVLLSDVYTMYHSVHGYHWNLKGSDFPEFHKLFNKIYDDVWESADGIAENMLKLGYDAPYLLTDFLSLTTINAQRAKSNDKITLCLSLLDMNSSVLASLNNVFQMAQDQNKQGICNFIADRIDKHTFWQWWLAASTGVDITTLDQDVTVETYEAPDLDSDFLS